MRLSRRHSIATDTRNINTLRQKKTETQSKTTDDADELARIEAKLKRERDELKDIYDDAVDKGLNEALLLKLEDDLQAKGDELERVRSEYSKAANSTYSAYSVLRAYYSRKLKESTRLTNSDEELSANKKAAKPNPQNRLSDKEAIALFEKNGKKFDAKVKEFKQKYEDDQDFAAKIDELRGALANGDWVFLNDKHDDETAFALAGLLIERAKPGKLLLEQPYSLNWDNDMLTGMLTYGDKVGTLIGPWPAVLSKNALTNDWLPVPADGVANHTASVETEALIGSGVTGHDNKLKTSADGKGNWVRQNYIGRNLFHEMKNSETGGIVIFGTQHLTGNTKTGESALQDIVTTKSAKKTKKITYAKGDSTSDYFAQIVPKTLRKKPKYSNGPKLPKSSEGTLKRFLKRGDTLSDLADHFKQDEGTIRQWIQQIDPNNKLLKE